MSKFVTPIFSIENHFSENKIYHVFQETDKEIQFTNDLGKLYYYPKAAFVDANVISTATKESYKNFPHIQELEQDLKKQFPIASYKHFMGIDPNEIIPSITEIEQLGNIATGHIVQGLSKIPDCTPKSILLEADKIVNGDRNDQYGDPSIAFKEYRDILKTTFGIELTEVEICKVLMSIKLGRLKHKYKRDSIVDLCGYSEILNRLENV